MKHLRFLSAVLTVLVVIALLALALPARADIYSTRAGSFTNTSLSGTNLPFYGNVSTNITTPYAGTSSNLTVNSDPIPIRQGWGLTLMPIFKGTNTLTVTNQVIMYFDVGVLANGVTNWSTTSPFTIRSALNSSNTVIDYTNIPPSSLNNASFVRWSTISVTGGPAGTNNVVTVSNLLWSTSSYAP